MLRAGMSRQIPGALLGKRLLSLGFERGTELYDPHPFGLKTSTPLDSLVLLSFLTGHVLLGGQGTCKRGAHIPAAGGATEEPPTPPTV